MLQFLGWYFVSAYFIYWIQPTDFPESLIWHFLKCFGVLFLLLVWLLICWLLRSLGFTKVVHLCCLKRKATWIIFSFVLSQVRKPIGSVFAHRTCLSQCRVDQLILQESYWCKVILMVNFWWFLLCLQYAISLLINLSQV